MSTDMATVSDGQKQLDKYNNLGGCYMNTMQALEGECMEVLSTQTTRDKCKYIFLYRMLRDSQKIKASVLVKLDRIGWTNQ